MSVLVAVLTAGSAFLLLPPDRRLRPSTPPSLPAAADTGMLLRLRPLVAGLAAAGGYVVLGGPLGVMAGLAAGWLCWKVLGDSEGPAAARRREQLARDLPTGVDLIAACVQAGAAVESALLTVADAMGGPLADELRGVHHRLALGIDPVNAWRGLDSPALQPLARAVLRAHESGAAVSEAVVRLSEDLREQARTEVLTRANAVEVRAAGPLAVCFLPAFLLVGVVPLVAGMLGSIDLLR